MLHLPIGKIRKIERSLDVRDVLHIALGENNVDLFERALLGLGVEEVDDGDEAEVYHGEEEVSSPLDVGNHDWGDHHDGEVEEPVEAGRDGVGADTGAEGVDLCRVQPRHWQPCCTKDGNIGE